MENSWKLAVGQSVEWETSGHGYIQRKGVVIAHVPAGVSADTFEVIDPNKIGRGTQLASGIDRYAIEVPRLNSQGNPVKSGALEIKLPNRWLLEKAIGINKN
jgi:hypothetical protein